MATSDIHDLLIATTNAGKMRELIDLLSGFPLRLRSLSEFPSIEEVAETGRTFAENATLKARQYGCQSNLWTLADDSGLEVDALGGAPGVLSARYGGAKLTAAERNARLLSALKLTVDKRRSARFICVVALFEPEAGAAIKLFTGTCEGHLSNNPRGNNGFGYDPVFVPSGYARTFAELSDEIKDQISHRGQALAAVRAYLTGRFLRP